MKIPWRLTKLPAEPFSSKHIRNSSAHRGPRNRAFPAALSLRYAELVYYGLWFAPLREALDGFFNVAQQRVTGAVGLKLWKGTLNVTSAFRLFRFIARTSPASPWPLQPQGRRSFITCLRYQLRSG